MIPVTVLNMGISEEVQRSSKSQVKWSFRLKLLSRLLLDEEIKVKRYVRIHHSSRIDFLIWSSVLAIVYKVFLWSHIQ